ncbi:hypothetical protein MASR1M32_10300 [Rhodobacter sp.]
MIVGTHPKRPYGWRRGADGRDAGDIPSARHQRSLLAHSDAHALGLTAEHLIRGATEAEIEAILAARLAPPPAFVSRRRRPDAPARVAAE